MIPEIELLINSCRRIHGGAHELPASSPPDAAVTSQIRTSIHPLISILSLALNLRSDLPYRKDHKFVACARHLESHMLLGSSENFELQCLASVNKQLRYSHQIKHAFHKNSVMTYIQSCLHCTTFKGNHSYNVQAIIKLLWLPRNNFLKEFGSTRNSPGSSSRSLVEFVDYYIGKRHGSSFEQKPALCAKNEWSFQMFNTHNHGKQERPGEVQIMITNATSTNSAPTCQED